MHIHTSETCSTSVFQCTSNLIVNSHLWFVRSWILLSIQWLKEKYSETPMYKTVGITVQSWGGILQFWHDCVNLVGVLLGIFN